MATIPDVTAWIDLETVVGAQPGDDNYGELAELTRRAQWELATHAEVLEAPLTGAAIWLACLLAEPAMDHVEMNASETYIETPALIVEKDGDSWRMFTPHAPPERLDNIEGLRWALARPGEVLDDSPGCASLERRLRDGAKAATTRLEHGEGMPKLLEGGYQHERDCQVLLEPVQEESPPEAKRGGRREAGGGTVSETSRGRQRSARG